MSAPVSPEDIALPASPRVAAVAVILAGEGEDLHLCLGRRRPYAGDPWSGDFAFPGGKAHPGDRSLHDIAARETAEETGVMLAREQLAGRLGRMKAYAGDDRPPLPVHPLIYRLIGPLPPIAAGAELAEAMWVPLPHFWDQANWITFTYPGDGLAYAGIRLSDHHVWGFTLRAIVGLSVRLGSSLADRLTEAELPYLDFDG